MKNNTSLGYRVPDIPCVQKGIMSSHCIYESSRIDLTRFAMAPNIANYFILILEQRTTKMTVDQTAHDYTYHFFFAN